MPEQPDANNKGDSSADSSIPPLIKAYVDAEIEKSREHESETRKKKWKNSWRSASPITKGTFILTVAIAVATIGYAIIAAFQLTKMSGQLDSMNRTYDEIHKQTRAVQWSEYMACLNAQAAQSTFIQAQNGARDSHAAAVATVEQTAAGIEGQRAIINFLPRTPYPSEQTGSNLTVPFSIKNDGKSRALDVHLHFKAILLNATDTLHIDKNNFSSMSAHYIPAGNDFPGKPEDPHYQPATPGITVKDSKGSTIGISSKEASDFWRSGNKLIVVYGDLTYSDFAGTYQENFCDPMFVMNPGTVRITTPIEKTCANYNRQQNRYRILPTIDSSATMTAGQLNPVPCAEPSK